MKEGNLKTMMIRKRKFAAKESSPLQLNKIGFFEKYFHANWFLNVILAVFIFWNSLCSSSFRDEFKLPKAINGKNGFCKTI